MRSAADRPGGRGTERIRGVGVRQGSERRVRARAESLGATGTGPADLPRHRFDRNTVWIAPAIDLTSETMRLRIALAAIAG